MKAARLVGPRQFEVMDIARPETRPGEVLVRMESLSICGSDLRTYDHTFPEEAYPLATGVPCHECAGVVEESRNDAIKPGQRVIALSGGLIEYASVAPGNIVPVAEGIPSDLAVLCQPVGTVVYAIQEIGAVLGRSFVVLGQGPIGLSFTDFLARAGAAKIIVTDPHPYRLEAARNLGATHTIDPTHEDVAAAVADITGGAMAEVSIDCAGTPEVAHQLFQVIRKSGTVVLFALPHEETVFPFDWMAMYEKLPRILTTNSSRGGERLRCVAAAVDLVEQGRLDLSYLVTHHVPFAEVSRAYETYSRKLDNSLKVIIDV